MKVELMKVELMKVELMKVELWRDVLHPASKPGLELGNSIFIRWLRLKTWRLLGAGLSPQHSIGMESVSYKLQI